MLLLLLLTVCCHGAKIEMVNSWLHHQMEPFELSHHFGVDSPDQVQPEMYQVISIDTNEPDTKTKRSGIDHSIKITAFDLDQTIHLSKNEKLLSKEAKIYVDEIPFDMDARTDCHFLHNSEQLSAAISNCNGDFQYDGHFLHQGKIFEIKPLHERFDEVLGVEKWHIITQRPINHLPDFEAESPDLNLTKQLDFGFDKRPEIVKRSNADLTFETALFLDPTAYRSYMSFYRQDSNKVVNMLLAFMNGIQSLYHFKSLGRRIDFTLVHLKMLTSTPFNDRRGEREGLLEEFCKYQSSENPESDSDPNHWDIALFASGLDFFDGRTGNQVTMGLAPVVNPCHTKHNCVIGEMGTKKNTGKLYPSTGFTSVFVMAHEIGHNMGMHHDGGAGCPSNGYVMSASRGTKGEVEWSRCSADIVRKMETKCLMDNNGSPAQWDHYKKYKNMPGLSWSADEQCQYLIQDPEGYADASDLSEICQKLWCKSRSKTGYYAAGPALEGTRCSKDQNKVCHEGQCIGKPNVPEPSSASAPKWSKWTDWGSCRNGCIQGAKGYQTRHRFCVYSQQATVEGCQGQAIQKRTCSDPNSCNRYLSPTEFASASCQNFMDINTRLSFALKAEGKQMPYNSGRPEQSCAVYCAQVRSPEFLSPRPYFAETENINLFFPDGTHCHNDGSEDYYCIKNVCEPENQSRNGRALKKVDVGISQNVDPNEDEVSQELLDFFSVDNEGKPKSDAVPATGRNANEDQEFELDDEMKVDKRSPQFETRVDEDEEMELEQPELPRNWDWIEEE